MSIESGNGPTTRHRPAPASQCLLRPSRIQRGREHREGGGRHGDHRRGALLSLRDHRRRRRIVGPHRRAWRRSAPSAIRRSDWSNIPSTWGTARLSAQGSLTPGYFVFYTDADNQFDMNELPLLLAWSNQADVVAGFRRVRQDPFLRRANAWAWNRLVRALFYVPVRDIDCAFKLYRREPLASIEVESRGAMIDTEIMVKLARRGSAIVEVGVTHLPRTAGTARGADPKVILRALREVWRMYPTLSRLDPGAPSAPFRGGGDTGPLLRSRNRPGRKLRSVSRTSGHWHHRSIKGPERHVRRSAAPEPTSSTDGPRPCSP